MRNRPLLIGVMTALTAGLCAGCAKARAHEEPQPPPLNAPPPPARLLPPLAGGPIQGAIMSAPTEAAPPPPPARRRPESTRLPESSRQEPKPADAPKGDLPPEVPHPEEAPHPSEPAPVLQLAPAAESNAAEPTIRKQLSRAAIDLSRVDYLALSVDAKAQYDTAKRFMVLADQAIKDRNFVFARTLADKAAVIAGVLSSR